MESALSHVNGRAAVLGGDGGRGRIWPSAPGGESLQTDAKSLGTGGMLSRGITEEAVDPAQFVLTGTYPERCQHRGDCIRNDCHDLLGPHTDTDSVAPGYPRADRHFVPSNQSFGLKRRGARSGRQVRLCHQCDLAVAGHQQARTIGATTSPNLTSTLETDFPTSGRIVVTACIIASSESDHPHRRPSYLRVGEGTIQLQNRYGLPERTTRLESAGRQRRSLIP